MDPDRQGLFEPDLSLAGGMGFVNRTRVHLRFLHSVAADDQKCEPRNQNRVESGNHPAYRTRGSENITHEGEWQRKHPRIYTKVNEYNEPDDRKKRIEQSVVVPCVVEHACGANRSEEHTSELK